MSPPEPNKITAGRQESRAALLLAESFGPDSTFFESARNLIGRMSAGGRPEVFCCIAAAEVALEAAEYWGGSSTSHFTSESACRAGLLEPALSGPLSELVTENRPTAHLADELQAACGLDLFALLHHRLFSRRERHSRGQEFTPSWLVNRVLSRLQTGKTDRIIDPACGSGAFLVAALHRAIAHGADPAEAMHNIYGIDADPLAAWLARMNLLVLLRLNDVSAREADLEILTSDIAHAEGWSRRMDVIVGNPPWIAYRHAEPALQQMMRDGLQNRFTTTDLRLPGQLITHLDSSVWVVLEALQRFLSPEGRFGFIMPSSLLSADQYAPFRRGDLRLQRNNAHLQFDRIDDYSGLHDLFSVGAIALYGHIDRSRQKRAGISGSRFTGRAGQSLTDESPVIWQLSSLGNRTVFSPEASSTTRKKKSYHYREKFRQGATLVPRAFWFAGRMESEGLHLESRGTGKRGPTGRYRNVRITGCVEPQFLYCTAIGDDILPFALRNLRLIVLPMDGEGRLYCAADAEKAGLRGLQSWMEQSERVWQATQSRRSAKMTVVERINYRRDASDQQLDRDWIVLYPNLQRVACAVAFSAGEATEALRLTTGITTAGFVADTATYCYRTDDAEEAAYLAALLNSPYLDARLQQLRGRSQRNQPNVHKRLLDSTAIPPFDPDNELHTALAHLGQAGAAAAKALARQHDLKDRYLGEARARIRVDLETELRQIDDLVRSLIP